MKVLEVTRCSLPIVASSSGTAPWVLGAFLSLNSIPRSAFVSTTCYHLRCLLHGVPNVDNLPLVA